MEQTYRYCFVGILLFLLSVSGLNAGNTSHTLSAGNGTSVEWVSPYCDTDDGDTQNYSSPFFSNVSIEAITLDYNFLSSFKSYAVRVLSFHDTEDKADLCLTNTIRFIHFSSLEPVRYYIYTLRKIII